jgi:hypothetical protein
MLPNSNTKLDFKDYAISIDKVEGITGIDFFWRLEDILEFKVEKTIIFNFITR